MLHRSVPFFVIANMIKIRIVQYSIEPWRTTRDYKNFHEGSDFKIKCMLNRTVIYFGQNNIISNNIRYFTCQVRSSFIKMDSTANSGATLNKRTFSVVNQRLLKLKHEIKAKNKILVPLLIKCINKNI